MATPISIFFTMSTNGEREKKKRKNHRNLDMSSFFTDGAAGGWNGNGNHFSTSSSAIGRGGDTAGAPAPSRLRSKLANAKEITLFHERGRNEANQQIQPQQVVQQPMRQTPVAGRKSSSTSENSTAYNMGWGVEQYTAPKQQSTSSNVPSRGSQVWDEPQRMSKPNGREERLPEIGSGYSSNGTGGNAAVAAGMRTANHAGRGQAPQGLIDRNKDALWNAVTLKDYEEVEKLVLRDHVDVDFIAPDGWVRSTDAGAGGKTLLHHAAWVGDARIFAFLYEHGADFNEPRRRNWAKAKGMTPFHHACFYNRIPIVEFCLDQGADPNHVGEDGFTPMHLAARHGYTKLADVLIRAGARVDIPNKAGKTAIDLAQNEMKDILIQAAKHGATASSLTSKPAVALVRPY